MRLKEFINGAKERISHGSWGEEKLRSKDFPLSKKGGRVYPLTRQWRWRVTTLQVCGRKFRLMASYHKVVPEYSAILAEDLGKDSRVIARVEFHATHDGWHAHPLCDDFDSTLPGTVRPVGTRRVPRANSYHRHTEMLLDGKAMNDDCASTIVASVFNLGEGISLFSREFLPWKP
jgi:hypothetical protein